MKLEVNRLDMLTAAKKAARVAPSSSPVEVLNGILIECDDDSLEVLLTATNHDTAIQCKAEASVSESGSVLINAGKLVDMLTLLSSEHVEFYAENQGLLRVTGGRAVYGINCLPAKHYPKPVLPFPEETVKIEGICSLYKKTVLAASKDACKAALRCVSVKINGGALRAASCDGMKMMLVRGTSESKEAREFLIPAESLGRLASISSDADTFEVGDTGTEIVFTKENMMFSLKKLGGTFLDVMTVLKSVRPKYSGLVSAKRLLDALALISTAAGSQPVRISLADSKITLTCDGDKGAVTTTIPAVVTVATPESGFYYNLSWLLKVVQTLEGKIKLEMDEKGFMLVKSSTEVYMQLPVNKPSVKPRKTDKKNKPAEAETPEEAA